MSGTYNGSDFREGFDVSTGSYKDAGDRQRAENAARTEQQAQAEKNRAAAQPKPQPQVMAPQKPTGRVRSPSPKGNGTGGDMAPALPGSLANGFGALAGGVVPVPGRVGTMGTRTAPTGYLTGGGFGGGPGVPSGVPTWAHARTAGWGLVAGDAVMPSGARPGSIPAVPTNFQFLSNGLSGTPVNVNPVQPSPQLAGYKSVLGPSQPVAYPQTSGGTYTIKAGDTLASIASRLGTTVADLKAKNNISDVNKIYSGSKLTFDGNMSSYADGAKTAPKTSALSAIDTAADPAWADYYKSVKGGANYFSSGKNGPGDTSNVTPWEFTTKSGQKFDLNTYPDAQEAFNGFLTELDASGYEIKNLGSQVIRNKRNGSGPSEHSYGTAIDINGEIVDGEKAARNQYGKNLVTDLPPNVSEMAAKYGLSWGGDWTSVKDAMHFEYTGKKPFKGKK